jgi:hypothetical protein
MRASRQTELQREFPLHVVCSWLGNSPRIAQQSYLLVTEDDFAKAAGVEKVMVEGLGKNQAAIAYTNFDSKTKAASTPLG